MIVKNGIVVTAGLCICACFADAIPTDRQIRGFFEMSGTNRECYTNMLPYFCSMRDAARAGTCSNELRHAQYLILTNVVERPLATNGNYLLNFAPKVDMLAWVCGFSSVRSDVDAANYLADSIGFVQPLPTCDYTNELREACLSNDVMSCEMRWRPIFSYNNRLSEYRHAVMLRFHSLYFSVLKTVPESDQSYFLTNVINRARLTESEVRTLLDTEYD